MDKEKVKIIEDKNKHTSLFELDNAGYNFMWIAEDYQEFFNIFIKKKKPKELSKLTRIRIIKRIKRDEWSNGQWLYISTKKLLKEPL